VPRKKATPPEKRKKRRKRKPKYIEGPSVQYHHQVYEPEDGEVVGRTAGHLFRGEHSVVTALRRQTRNISSFFIFCLEEWLKKIKTGKILRTLDKEIEQLTEGESYHCRYCGAGFLVKDNRKKHEIVCAIKD